MNDYLYAFASNEEERPLSMLEMRALFGDESRYNLLRSPIEVEPGRSPFIKMRIKILFEADSLRELAERAGDIELGQSTFKVLAIDNYDPGEKAKFEYDEKRAMEREIGSRFRGRAEMRKPDREFGFARIDGRWRLGELVHGEAAWLKHNDKPRKYSTALSTRVARAVVNIAVPRIEGVRAIDPCCGIGTVLVEALSMGIDIAGREINPLAAIGARENVAFFEYGSATVTLGDMREITESYDVAILDMPYNLCSVLSLGEKREMLASARKFAARLVVVTVEEMDSIILEAGFKIQDRCTVNKGKFTRQVLVCE
ncbi:TRM11 family SAM-dependent methyltransferase [Cohnella cholangitidis]|uniref:RNA methyltransferase n=1 Tax=Cohnella cholangitidis TaxID=2598458 RepID=A0A7G5BWY3_9BACL|nr:RNA methyltransferase [Cohnella cholangitidis]QMV41467.1 RNA methyltransferase [Cohnella cholangitidis]